MKKRLFSFIILALILIANYVNAQEKLDPSRLPKEYEEAFKNRFPNAEKVQWFKGGTKDTYNVKFTLNKKRCFASFEKNAKLTEATIGMTFDELPEVVKNSFKNSKYGNWRVQEVIKKVNDYETLYYITAKDKVKQYLPFNEKGELLQH